MTLDNYIRVLKRMVDDQEVTIKSNERAKVMTDIDLAIEIGIQSGVKICLEKAELIDEI